MPSRVSVSNLALAVLGESDKLTDPLDDSKAAVAIARVWDDVRDATLRAHLWNFAMWEARLTASSEEGRFGYAYCFPLPPDYLRLDIKGIAPAMVRGDHKIASRRLYADDLGPVIIPYVRRVTDVGAWDPLFVEAFACHLAWWIADDITGDKKRKQLAWNGYQVKLRQAKGIDGGEDPPEPPIDTRWATARYDAGAGSLGAWGRRTE